jgi:hypothetical protein
MVGQYSCTCTLLDSGECCEHSGCDHQRPGALHMCKYKYGYITERVSMYSISGVVEG